MSEPEHPLGALAGGGHPTGGRDLLDAHIFRLMNRPNTAANSSARLMIQS